jgi:hypothetical protein
VFYKGVSDAKLKSGKRGQNTKLTRKSPLIGGKGLHWTVLPSKKKKDEEEEKVEKKKKIREFMGTFPGYYLPQSSKHSGEQNMFHNIFRL